MQQNVTTGLGGDLCGLPAKQTDEGNLSCSSRFAELQRAGLGWGGGWYDDCHNPLLLTSPVTFGGREGEMGERKVTCRGADEGEAVGKCQTVTR